MSEEKKTISLKLLVDTRARKVLFAEASKDFVDFLFNMLSLPIGIIIGLLTKKGMVGCLGDLCKSIEDLNTDYMQPNVTKNSILEPFIVGSTSVEMPLLLQYDAPAHNVAQKYYRCSVRSYSNCQNYFSDGKGARCPQCSNTMSYELCYVAAPKGSTETATSSGGYVKGVVTYMVMDNLEVKPMSTISSIALINKLNVKDVSSLVEREIQIGLNECLAILKASLETQTVLTTMFLGLKEEKK